MFQREIAVLVHFSKNKENNESLGGMFEREIPVLVCHSGFGRWLEAEQIQDSRGTGSRGQYLMQL